MNVELLKRDIMAKAKFNEENVSELVSRIILGCGWITDEMIDMYDDYSEADREEAKKRLSKDRRLYGESMLEDFEGDDRPSDNCLILNYGE